MKNESFRFKLNIQMIIKNVADNTGGYINTNIWNFACNTLGYFTYIKLPTKHIGFIYEK